MAESLTSDELSRIDRYWRAANYLSVGQIYLRANPLLREPLRPEHVKPRLLGHWGTTPGPELHLRPPESADPEAGSERPLRHGAGPRRPRHRRQHVSRRLVLRALPEGRPGARRVSGGCSRQFSWPGRNSEPRGSRDARLDPRGRRARLLAPARVRRRLRQSGPDRLLRRRGRRGRDRAFATSWHSNKFLNPARDGAVLPILHLNGYKIAGPTVLGAPSATTSCGPSSPATVTRPSSSKGTTPRSCTRRWRRRSTSWPTGSLPSRRRARANGFRQRPRWPMIVLRTPKGWTGPKVVDGKPVEGTFRSHQVPVAEPAPEPGAPPHPRGVDEELSTRKSSSTTPGGSGRSSRPSLPRAISGWG